MVCVDKVSFLGTLQSRLGELACAFTGCQEKLKPQIREPQSHTGRRVPGGVPEEGLPRAPTSNLSRFLQVSYAPGYALSLPDLSPKE